MRKLMKGFTLIELMIVIAIIAIIAAIAIPGLLQSQRAANERSASTSLKTITSAQADFRANDRDGNRVNDFWTANVAGLYTVTSCAVAGVGSLTSTDPSVKLIELSLAAADAVSDATLTAGGENVSVTTYSVVSAKAGYWYQALVSDASAAAPEDDYTIDTGGLIAMGAVHNASKYGMGAWPDSTGAGKFAYLVNENNTIFRRALTGTVKPATTTPPGLATLAGVSVWPTDADLKSYWGKVD
jgi:prepilin-type N-terminal cleavage/methylation domain-containing protein